MSSKFRSYSTASSEETVYRIYDFVVNSGQTAVRLVNDTGSAVALHKAGTGFVSSWASASDCPDGSYLIVEPVTACGSTRWQMYFQNSVADIVQCGFAPRGGWTNAAQNFGGNPTVDPVRFNDNAAPGAGSSIYMGTGTFAIDGSNTGTYIWANIRDTGSASADQFTYGGNYYPWSIAYDTRPCCVLARIPTVSDTALSIGRNSSDTNCLSRTSVEPAQTTSWQTSGYARVCFDDTPSTPGATCAWRDGSGAYIPKPAYLFRGTTGDMGHFGDHLRICDDALADYDVDDATTPTHIVIGHLWLHYDLTL